MYRWILPEMSCLSYQKICTCGLQSLTIDSTEISLICMQAAYDLRQEMLETLFVTMPVWPGYAGFKGNNSFPEETLMSVRYCFQLEIELEISKVWQECGRIAAFASWKFWCRFNTYTDISWWFEAVRTQRTKSSHQFEDACTRFRQWMTPVPKRARILVSPSASTCVIDDAGTSFPEHQN